MMRLFSGPLCLYGHTCRIVMQEKMAECDFRYLGEEDIEQELAEHQSIIDTLGIG